MSADDQQFLDVVRISPLVLVLSLFRPCPDPTCSCSCSCVMMLDVARLSRNNKSYRTVNKKRKEKKN